MTYMKTKVAAAVVALEARINARLDAQSAAQPQYLTTTTGLGISEAVRMSLAHYYHASACNKRLRCGTWPH